MLVNSSQDTPVKAILHVDGGPIWQFLSNMCLDI